MEEAIGKYNYVVDCLKSDKTPEYQIKSNPVLSNINIRRGSTTLPKSRTSTNNIQIPIVGEMLKTSPVFEDKKNEKSHKTNLGFKIQKKLNIPTDKSNSIFKVKKRK